MKLLTCRHMHRGGAIMQRPILRAGTRVVVGCVKLMVIVMIVSRCGRIVVVMIH